MTATLRAPVGVAGLAALGAGAGLAGGLPAAGCGVAGAMALCAVLARPGWAPGPTLVALALVGQVGLAEDRSWWRVWVAAMLLGAFLATSEIGQAGAWPAGGRSALGVHRDASIPAAIGVGVVLGCAAASVRSPASVSLVLGLAAAATVLIVVVLREVLR